MPRTHAYELDVVIHNDARAPFVDESSCRHATEATFSSVASHQQIAGSKYTVSLAFVSDEKIQELNAQYRHMNKPTDILSFGFYEDEHQKGQFTGDLILSCARIEAQARQFGHTKAQELLFLIIHGVLHLFGYTDDTDETREEMERIGHEILDTIQ